MKTMRMMAIAVLIVGSGLALHATSAQQPGTKRTDLQRHDLSAPGREVVQVRVDFDPGYVAPGTRIRAKRSSMSSKARWSIRSTASCREGEARRRLVRPGRNNPLGKEHWHEQRGRARDVCCRKREAANHAGEVSASE